MPSTTATLTHTFLTTISPFLPPIYQGVTLPSFLALLFSTCSNYMLAPIRDATALTIGVHHIPNLTIASTILALASSVPVGWLFEAPDPSRRRFLRNWGLTRGETQGSSLALFYRFFAFFLLAYSAGNYILEQPEEVSYWGIRNLLLWCQERTGKLGSVIFFLVVHIMRLHGISLIWGVASEAMEYEEGAERRGEGRGKVRLKRLSFIGFGGTLGGIVGSIITSLAAHIFRLSGLLLIAALLLEMSANLSLELGNIMYRHWIQEQAHHANNTNNQSTTPMDNPTNSTADVSLKRTSSSSSMKRIASGNSLSGANNIQRSQSASSLDPQKSLSDTSSCGDENGSSSHQSNNVAQPPIDDTFKQRLLRGITTILRSKLLMSIFTYNALYASTTVLLSFQRAQLIADRDSSSEQTTESYTAFLAKINTTSSFAVFILQVSGFGAAIAHRVGMRVTLTLMPVMRVLGVVCLMYYHFFVSKKSNLWMFLILDECCKVINFAIAKPVRESLWRGLSVEARYEAKPIVDTLANRWGGGSAAFLVQIVGSGGGGGEIFGFPVNLVLCVGMGVWWMGVSAHLGLVRRRIDVELKKMQ